MFEVLLLYNKAHPHSSLYITDAVSSFGWIMLPQRMKDRLQRQHFQDACCRVSSPGVVMKPLETKKKKKKFYPAHSLGTITPSFTCHVLKYLMFINGRLPQGITDLISF